ncbi:YPDG domain-containing protein [Corynebacterium urealyticum]|uniref:YPDG domain-containing protein n=1 Tax=Corynebacterium urealyticum TaxID=43771 RepID=UPI0018E1952D|nr:YPDG domain-containing protein [Corynebacterium urealyticum]QQB07472.1 YPDG domain-containing protein [Corynebacterium urealyticum]
MANLRGLIARGGKSGAFALGFSDKMKSVAGAMAVLALATTGTIVVQSQNAPAAANVLQEPNAIHSPGEHRANHTVNGAVYVDRSGINSNKTGDDQGLSNVKVYAQWMDERVKGYAVSPVYTTNTRADGTYTVDFPEWTDSQGNKHLFKANPYQKLRVWIENPDSSKYEISYMEGDGVFKGSIERYASVWSVDLVNGGNVRDQNIALTETPESWLQKPEADWKQSEAKTGDGYINGRVFWDQKNLAGAGDVPQYNTGHGDVAVSGVKVVGSYLRDEVANELDQWKKDNRGYTQLELKQAQQDAIKKFETDNPGQSAIAETVTATTDAQGQYVLQFNGTYGVTSTNIGTLPNAEAKKLFHTVADSAASGQWATSGVDVAQSAAGNVSKHINMDYVYVQPILDESANVNPYNFRTAMFTNPTWNISYATAPKRHAVDNSDFALKPSKPGFDVVDYNTTDNPAFKGTEVQTRTVGLVPNTPYTIQWYDAAGEKVGTTCKLDSDDLGAVPSCPFTVPDTAKAGDVFTAVVELPDGTPFLADSFIVKEPMTDSMDPKYEDKLVVPGEETKSTPTFTDKDGQKVDAPKDAKFSIPEDFKAPEGYEVKIDENTGEVTVTFPDKSKLNKDTAEEFSVPVTVTYPDGTKDDAKANFKLDTDGDGDPDVTDPDDDGDGIPDEDDSNPKVPNANDHFDPVYEDGSGKPGSDVKIDPPTFKDKDGNETKAPEGTKFTPGDDAPEGVKVDENTGAITVTIPEGANPGDEIKVPVVVTYPDGTKDNVEVTVTVTDKDNGVFEPKYKSELVVPGKETKSSPTFTDKEGKDVEVPADSKFTIGEDFTAPEGYTVTIDESNGEITVTVDGDKLNKDTVEEFDVPVTVTYPDGSTDKTDANFKLDTDGDGEPDVTDPDDDGDGIPDEDDSNPKVPNVNDHYDPEYKDGSGKPGEDVKVEKPEFKDKDGEPTEAPEGTKFTPGENAPDGVTIDENTGEITVTIPEGANPGDEIKVPVVVTYPDGTKDNVEVTVTVTEKDNGVYEPGYEDGSGQPGDDVKIDKPVFKDNNDEETTPPEGTKFEKGEGAPGGVTVNEDGSVKVTIPEDAEPGTKIEVPVVVTYPDGSTDEVTVTVTVDKPEAPVVKDNEKYEPGYEDGSGKPGEDVTVPAPEFKDKDGQPTEAPDGTTFGPGENTPGGVTVNEDGSVKVTIPEDAEPGTKIEVPVVVTYPDGSTDEVTVTVTVDEPEAPVVKDNEKYEPGYEDGSGKPGEDVTVPAPEFKDKDGQPTEAPDGTTFGPGENTPGGVTVNEDGSVKVTIPEDAEPGTKIEVPVVVTYPDGSTDEVTVTVTVDEPEQPEAKDNEKYEPEYDGGTGQPGDEVEIDAPTFKDGDNNEVEVPSGTTFTPGENAPESVTVNEDGSIDVTIPEDATPGDKITVPVVVTYPDNTQDNVDVTVTVTAKDATPVTPVAPTENNPSSGASADDPASCELPPYVTVTETEGVEYKVTVDGKELAPDAEGKYVYEYGQTVKVEATPATGYTFPDGATTTWTWTTKQNEDCKAPETKDNENFEPGYEDGSGKPGEDVTVDKPVFKDNNGKETTPPEGTKFEKGEGAPENVTVNEDGSITVKVPEDAKPGDKITVPVVVTYPDGSTDEVEVTVTVEQPDAPAEKPDWKDDKGKPGDKVEIPNNGGPVQDGTTVETEGPGKAEIDENGNLVVDIDKDANPGDKVVVIVKDKDGNEIDRVVVEVEKPDAPAKDPKWEDTTTTPDKPVEIPNTGGDVPEGTTVETEGPGKAEIKPDGTITVTPDKDAKPGDKIKVVVKDKDGKVIDEVTVTITEKPKPGGSSDLPEGLIPGLIGGGIIGGIIGGNLGSSHGSSTPGHGAGSGQGAGKAPADKGAGNQGGKGAGQSGTSQSGAQSGAAQSGASSSSASSADRQGSLAVTGVSGVAIMLGAAAMALAIGGALLAGRRRREN